MGIFYGAIQEVPKFEFGYSSFHPAAVLNATAIAQARMLNEGNGNRQQGNALGQSVASPVTVFADFSGAANQGTPDRLTNRGAPYATLEDVKKFDPNNIGFNLPKDTIVTQRDLDNLISKNVKGVMGRTTAYGYANDSTPDRNSSAGIGAWVPDNEAAKIRRGEDSPYKLRPGDIAVSRDVEAKLRKEGFNPGDDITFDKANGTTHTGRWMDRTADVYEGKSVTGRFDIFSPSGVPKDDGTTVTGFHRTGSPIESAVPDPQPGDGQLQGNPAIYHNSLFPDGSLEETQKQLKLDPLDQNASEIHDATTLKEKQNNANP